MSRHLSVFSRKALRLPSAACGLAALLFGAAAIHFSGPAAAQPAPSDTRVTGTLLLLASDGDGPEAEIELPDSRVDLVLNGQAVVDSATTALDGRFSTTAPGPGTYQICWELGGERGCGNRFKVGDDTTVWAGRVAARVKRPYMHGRVLTGDGRPCWVNDSFFGLDVSTEVRGGGHTTRANTQGEFALIGPVPGTFRLTATCEKSEAGATVTLGSGGLRHDLAFANRAPRLTSLAGSDGSKFVTRTTMGETLKLVSSTRELDGDVVEYMWRTADPAGVLSGSASATEEWTLPSANGRQSVYVMARDGKGGYAFERFDMQVGVMQIDVSGQAIDEVTGNPIPKATVTLGESSAVTDDNGWFSLTTKPVPDDRYVLNIRHPNYTLMSRIYDRSAYGNTYQMTRTQVTIGQGDRDIEIEDTMSAGACGTGPKGEGRRIPRLVAPTFLREEAEDGKETSPGRDRETQAAIRELLKRQDDCSRRGVKIVIPAGALVDSDGKVWTGAVRASVATLNPARRALPGDYQAITAGGERAEMLSFGALYADFTDLQGRRLDLMPGMAAEIITPVSDLQAASADPTIALWSYDERTGFWMEEGQAELRQTPSGPVYAAKTEHFSSINMDVAGNNPDEATCVRVEVDAAFSGWSNLVLRAYVSYGGDSVQVKETALDSAQYHAIYRIPYGNAFPPNTLRLELRGTANGQQLVLLDNIINTDARPKMTGNNLWPPYPYEECGVPILLTPAPGVVPAYGDIDATGRPSFLTGPFGQFNPANGAQLTIDYYNALDPAGDKETLGEWWQANGFGADGLGAGNASYVNQAYLNDNDLGFGRDMHCLTSGSDLACYVTNYGLPDQNANNATAAENKDPEQRGATVAMEYDASAPDAERVQFWVFGGGVSGSPRINFADLDGLGPKPVPFLCAVCHGGQPNLNANDKINHARFREFDLPSFRYSGDRSWDYGQATLNPTELGNFARLNEMVRDSTAGKPIGDLIQAWYPGGFAGGPAPVLPTPPAGWSGHSADYHAVYAKSCRTCHVARDAGNPDSFFVFNDFSFFQGTGYAVCGQETDPLKRRVMPNAFVTYKNFWVDVPRVLQYEAIVGAAANSCGNN